MLQFSVFMIPRQPLFEIKAVISFSADKPEQKKETFSTSTEVFASIETTSGPSKLELMRVKLEQIIPPSFKMKYRINNEQLIGSAVTHLSSKQAQRMTQKVEEYIHSASHSLNLK